ncbi:MAG TPA: hypothetical protein IAA67_03250 [Candidatus Avoscillospira stercorigallinarum]|uniref:Uncharacterized protein n=1 Tax=Candidatus Avoscillospira stercorigallinarum TaxID=2840708 RepID=A0A9D1CNQ6_9FIRM|nr:hypothetical protein [Candidatus Avoscillospira stercorigallinarum]
MLVRAKVSFAGPVSMAVGEVRDVPEDVAAPLLHCNYLETVKEKKPRGKGVENNDPSGDPGG